MIASVYMITAALFFSLQNLDVKVLTHIYGIWTITFFRSIIGTIICLSLLLSYKIKPIYGIEVKKLFTRGLLGSIAVASSFFAIQNLNLSLAIIIMATSSLWTGLLSLYKIPGSWKVNNTIGAILCITGLSLTAIAGFKRDNPHFWYGLLSALISAITVALISVTIIDIKTEVTYVIMLYSMCICMILSSGGMVYDVYYNGFEVGFHLLQLCLVGLGSFLGQFFKTKSLQLTTNLGVVVFRYFDIIFSIIFDVFILNTKLTTYDILCIFLIVMGCIINSV